MLIFGGWLLTLWITIQIRRSVYLEYSYLTIGMAFVAMGVVSLLCVLYAVRRRGNWGALYVVPVMAGLWTMVAIPNLAPYDTKSPHHIGNVADELESFSKQHGRFPDNETALSADVLKEPGPYYQNGRQLPFRTVLVPRATGPFLDSPGTDPGVIFYAVSADQQEAWLTGTELRFPRLSVGQAQFIGFLSLDGDTRVRHLHAGQMPVVK